MEKIIFFGLVIPILGFVLYLGATAIMNGFSAKNANKTENNIKNFKLLFDNSLELINFMQNPTQSKDNQNNVVKILSEKLGFSKNLENFFLLLIKKRRIFFIKKIAESFLKLCSKKGVK